jgi:hypothetical protein
MAQRGHRNLGLAGERGQASLLLLGLLAVLVAGTLILFGFGQALGARSKHQRAADLAAVSGAQVMSRHYQQLFEPAVFENGLSNLRHLSNEEFLALARAAALRGARRNGVAATRVEVDFPADGFAPTQIEVSTSGEARLRLGERPARERIPVKASATAEVAPDLNVASACPPTGPAAATTARWPTGWASRCVPTWPPRSTAWRQRPAARPGSTSRSAQAFAPTPNRRSSSPQSPGLICFLHCRAASRAARSLHVGGRVCRHGEPTPEIAPRPKS